MTSTIKMESRFDKFGVTLWSGTWSSGSINVPNVDDYVLLGVMSSDGAMSIASTDNAKGVSRTWHGFCVTGTSSQYIKHVQFSSTASGTCSNLTANQITHNASGNHSASSAWTVARIIGLVPRF